MRSYAEERAPTIRSFACLTVAVGLLSFGVTRAHDLGFTDTAVLLKADGTYLVDITIDVDALALGISQNSDSVENVAALEAMSIGEFEGARERARETLVRRVRLRFDGEKQRPSVSFPYSDDPDDDPAGLPTVLGTIARFTGRIPEGATEFTFGASRSFQVVQLTILEQSTASGVKQLLGPSEDSTPFPLGVGSPEAAAGPLETAFRFGVIGFGHILPGGLDHILFVLGLFLLTTRRRALLVQVSAFTVAHSLTLALSLYGIVSLSSRFVEPLIALSIAYVALENLLTEELKPWRPALVFGFGLLHGMGFAGALRELGLSAGEQVSGLIGFNLGVEAGQLAVLGLALLAIGWARNKTWYRASVVIPGSVIIGLIGSYWAVERILGG